jgi:hypothetical protein
LPSSRSIARAVVALGIAVFGSAGCAEIDRLKQAAGLSPPSPAGPPGIHMLSGPVIADGGPRDDGRAAGLAEAARAARCVAEVEARPEFAALRARSPEPEKMTFRHFADEAMVSEEERAALRRFMDAIAPCRPQFAADAPDDLQRALLATWAGQEKLYAELIARRVSWGEFNRRTHDLVQRAEDDARRLVAGR